MAIGLVLNQSASTPIDALAHKIISMLYDAIPDDAVIARRFLFYIPTYRLTDGHFSTMVKVQHITELMLIVHQ